jgi:hypothetical protein
MVKTNQTPVWTEVFFDSAGNPLRVSGSELARLLGRLARGRDPVDYAIRQLGFVRVDMVESALVIDLQTTTARRLAVLAAFYEIAGYEIAGGAPTKVVLMCRGEPDRSEIFSQLWAGVPTHRGADETQPLRQDQETRELDPDTSARGVHGAYPSRCVD